MHLVGIPIHGVKNLSGEEHQFWDNFCTEREIYLANLRTTGSNFPSQKQFTLQLTWAATVNTAAHILEDSQRLVQCFQCCSFNWEKKVKIFPFPQFLVLRGMSELLILKHHVSLKNFASKGQAIPELFITKFIF